MLRLIRSLFLLIVIGALGIGLYSAYAQFSGKEIIKLNFDPLFFIPKGGLTKPVLLRFAVMSDVHSDLNYSQIALDKAKERKAEYIIVTGDWTKTGTREELFEIKKIFDSAGIAYYSVPGDHDLWSSGLSNFKDIFGSNYYSFDKNNIHNILIDTSNTKIGLGKDQMEWLRKDLSDNNQKTTFVFMHLPPYHPTSYRTFWEKEGENSEIKKQADYLLSLLAEYRVRQIYAGDHHLSSNYTEPTSGVKIRIVGAITLERNLQKPRFDMVTVFQDRSYDIQEIVLN